ncbi:Ig-like domain-containing protein [Mycobacterium sp. 236(2023)]|uniref:L,D-transpeptidase n=1 Tax=Mycobacterium sp. 236(2023) TaxID=3038163 RepID=UPI0024157DEC|nr:Ig-like domain-containing protein [Mycobacterium sp. 236(2023)]MDG4665473.1 Ig-like domain-containing protein [Mycobacterium sp. 236(2023)]
MSVSLFVATQSGAPVEQQQAMTTAADAESLAEPPAPAKLIIRSEGDEHGIRPVDSVRVTATSGTITDVEMTNEQGRRVKGAIDADGREWTPAEPLGYGRTYTVKATGLGTDSTVAKEISRFSTVAPAKQTSVSLHGTSGAKLVDGATYGVGMVVVARFDADISDRAAAERQLKVTTTPRVEGSWYWVNDRKAHWRPREYYPPGTQVTVDAGIYGTDLGGGVYGQEDSKVGFRIGDARVSVADDATKQVSVFQNGKLVRTMPTSMGRGGTETVGGTTIHFWTQAGTYTVMEKDSSVVMDSSTYGLPVGSSSGYRLNVSNAVRISPDGIYLHELADTVWAQGNTNVSAGCLNLSPENAEWFFEFAQEGDVVEVRNTGGEPLEQWQNGDWSLPWDQWSQGSALRS